MLCAACLAAARDRHTPRRPGPGYHVLRTVQFLGALLVLWLAFVLVGRLLLTVPSSYHIHAPVKASESTEGR